MPFPPNRRAFPLALCTLLFLTCKPPVSTPVAQGGSDAPPANRAALRTSAPSRPETTVDRPEPPRLKSPEVRPFHRCFPEDNASSPPRPLTALLDRAADLYDQGLQHPGDRKLAERDGLPAPVQALYEESLTCAEEAARVEPRSAEAHYGRAVCLQELGRLDSARDAFTRALAVDPDDPETLAGAADLYINRLPPGVDHTETGLEYARRGSRRARRTKDKGLIARLALLEGQALNDLGHGREALSRLDAALSALDKEKEDDAQVRYERAVALFDLCRFDEARRGFEEVLGRVPDDAWAHHHLGLALEGLGRLTEAERQFERARKIAPRDFPAPLPVNPVEFREIVDQEVKGLSRELQEDLYRVSLETADLPDITDLTAEEPPLSPTILGLFRGAPLADNESEPSASSGAGAAVSTIGNQRTIVLYRKNLLRAVTSREELVTQVRTTLLHELGHLRGEDDEVLRARGLE